MGALLSRLPLTVILALTAIVELGLNRVGTHLVGPASKEDVLGRIVDQGGLFSFYLTGLLGLCVFTWGAVVLIRDRNLLRLPDRIAVTLLSALFLPLAGMGLVLNLPRSVAPYLNVSYGLLLLALTIGLLRRPGGSNLRAKLGVIYLTAPLLLHCYWLLTQQVPGLQPSGRYSELPMQLFETGEHLLVVGAFAAFLFFAPFPRRATLLAPLPIGLAALVTAGAALFIRFHYAEAAQSAYYGLGINLPPPSLHVLMHLAALYFFVLTVTTLLLRSGSERAAGVGLALVGLSGYQLQLPYQLLLTLTGMTEVVRSALEPSLAQQPQIPPPTADAWTTYLRRLAAACSTPPTSGEAVLLQSEGRLIGHVRGRRDGLPFVVRLLDHQGAVARLEIVVGDPPKEAAPLSLRRSGGCRGGRVVDDSRGATVKLAARELDRQFALRDSTGQAAALFADEQLRDLLVRWLHGWLGIWPQEGLRYAMRPGADGWPLPLAELSFSPDVATTEDLEGLLAMLCSLAARVGAARS
jgi:hypothetical protein